MDDLGFIGRFNIVEKLQSSTEFDTFIAQDNEIKVFIKKAKSIKSNNLILTEIDIYKKIAKSQYFVNLVDYSDEGELFWIALEYEEGEDLKSHIEKYGPVAELDWFELASNLQLALLDLHKANVIHRDIKPSNILISKNGPKLIDFSYSIEKTNSTSDNIEYEEDIFDSIDDQFLGTPAYSSPEHYSGEIAEEMDIFSLASTLAFASQGKSPFEKSSDTEAANAVKFESPNLKGLSPIQARFLNPFFVKNKSQRIRLKNQANGVQSHIKFIIEKKQTRDFLDWPQFADLSYSAASSQTTLGKASKLRVLSKQYYAHALPALRSKKTYFYALLVFITFSVGSDYINFVKKTNRIQESKIALDCLKNTRDEFLKTNYYLSSDESALNSDIFNLDIMSKICKDAQDIDNSYFQNSLAYYYGVLGDKKRQHDILLASAQKNPIFVNDLAIFYADDNNMELFGNDWLIDCYKINPLCAEIYARYLQESGRTIEALEFLNKYSDMTPELLVRKESLQRILRVNDIDYEAIEKIAKQDNLSAQISMWIYENSEGRFSAANRWAKEISKHTSVGYIFLIAGEAQTGNSSSIKTIDKCLEEFPLEPYCYEIKAKSLITDENTGELKNLSIENIKEAYEVAEKALLLGSKILVEEDEAFSKLFSEDSNDPAVVSATWNNFFDIHYRASTRNDETAHFYIAWTKYLVFDDLNTACKFYQKGLRKMKSLEFLPLQRVNPGAFRGNELAFNKAKFYKNLFEENITKNYESCS